MMEFSFHQIRNVNSYIINFWSSATDPNRLSCKICQDTSSTTDVCPVKIVCASIILPSRTLALISHKQMVWKWDELLVHVISNKPYLLNQNVRTKHLHDHLKHWGGYRWHLDSTRGHNLLSGGLSKEGLGCTSRWDLLKHLNFWIKHCYTIGIPCPKTDTRQHTLTRFWRMLCVVEH